MVFPPGRLEGRAVGGYLGPLTIAVFGFFCFFFFFFLFMFFFFFFFFLSRPRPPPPRRPPPNPPRPPAHSPPTRSRPPPPTGRARPAPTPPIAHHHPGAATGRGLRRLRRLHHRRLIQKRDLGKRAPTPRWMAWTGPVFAMAPAATPAPPPEAELLLRRTGPHGVSGFAGFLVPRCSVAGRAQGRRRFPGLRYVGLIRNPRVDLGGRAMGCAAWAKTSFPSWFNSGVECAVERCCCLRKPCPSPA